MLRQLTLPTSQHVVQKDSFPSHENLALVCQLLYKMQRLTSHPGRLMSLLSGVSVVGKYLHTSSASPEARP